MGGQEGATESGASGKWLPGELPAPFNCFSDVFSLPPRFPLCGCMWVFFMNCFIYVSYVQAGFMYAIIISMGLSFLLF